jgi:heme-degrading monooxygenase HmoA
MHVHIWKMQARKKKFEEYEKFGRQVTLPALKKIDGCLDAHFLKVFEAKKPQYLWVVYWRDHNALEAARTRPLWREQIKKFEDGKFYKTIPLELVCESLASFSAPGVEKAKKVQKTEKAENPEKEAPAESSEKAEAPKGFTGPTVEGE